MGRVLDDVTVLDLTRQFCTALSAAFLGDFGARVIRLDLLPAPPAGTSGRWNHEADLIHRNKLSVAINPSSPRGRGVLAALLAKADVIVTDWQRNELAAIGLDYASASQVRPDIVFARLSGFGPAGPDQDLPAIDELAAARTGAMPMLPQPGQPPVYTGAGAMHATGQLAFGVVTALLHRMTSGEGQQVDVSLFGANMYGSALDMQAFLAIGHGDRLLNPISRLDVSNPMSGSVYMSADGRWVTLTMPDTDRWWPAFSGIVGIASDDARFDTHDKRTAVNRLALIGELEERFRAQSAHHWRRLFQEKQLSADIIEQFDYPANDPGACANRYIVELDHPSFGKVRTLGFPIWVSDSPARLERLAPCVGQHTDQVLHELLGYSRQSIHELADAGVLA
ncbi:MAG: CoA transferase [Steroidobacteraceae bacterium]|nr:CoA transferase [Steroidobacteraceae bacterium]MBP7012607.1 CoA transferase [Steroidobacteraceae bacterium]